MANLNKKALDNLSFDLPPLAKQEKFAEAKRTIALIENHARVSLDELEAARFSLEDRAFSGEL